MTKDTMEKVDNMYEKIEIFSKEVETMIKSQKKILAIEI